MFGLSAKERLAQFQQQKGPKDAQVGKLSAGLKPTPGKLNSGPGPLKKPEPPKPAADLKKPIAPQPVKTKEEPKTTAAVEPAKSKEEPKGPVAPESQKPKEEPKKPAAPETVKPKEEPKKPAAPEPAKPKEEPKKTTAPELAKPTGDTKKPATPEVIKQIEEPKQSATSAASEPAKPKEEPKKPAAPEPAKPKEEPKKPVVPEPAKPKEEPKKPAAPEPAKPKEEPKKPAAPEPAKPKEEPKKPAASEPAKPKEEPKKPVAPEPAKPKEEPKKPVVPEPAKPKEEPKKPTAPEPVKPKEEPKKPVAPEPAKPAKLPNDATVKQVGEPIAAKRVEEPKGSTDDFFRGIFYFSGMGTLVGSALAEGVYVPEKTQRNALDSDEIESARERQRLRRGEEIIITARNQAQGLSTDFRHLQALLESLPTFTEAFEAQPLERRGVDQVIHGHVYFQQEQHQAPTHARPVHQHGLTSAAEIASHAPLHHSHLHQPQQPAPVVVAEAKRVPVGGVPVLPEQQRQRPPTDQHQDTAAASFAAAMDEFDRATSAAHQQPVFAALPPPARPPSEPSRPHPRERPTAAGEEQGEAGGTAIRPSGGHAGGHVAPAATQPPWQERYGQTEVAKFSTPRPFSSTGGDIDSKGVKPWQMSHLRTLEVKGYHIVSDSEPDAIKSYSPYLVSDRSQGADRQFYQGHQHRLGTAPSPSAAAAVVPFGHHSLDPSVGYSDL